MVKIKWHSMARTAQIPFPIFTTTPDFPVNPYVSERARGGS